MKGEAKGRTFSLDYKVRTPMYDFDVEIKFDRSGDIVEMFINDLDVTENGEQIEAMLKMIEKSGKCVQADLSEAMDIAGVSQVDEIGDWKNSTEGLSVRGIP
jgi:hypothetical protein